MLKSSAEGSFRDRGSKFIAYAFPIKKLEDFEEFLSSIKKDHPKARHFCYSWRLGPDEDLFRYNDDGEPGGSAGLPIFNQIKSKELYESAIVVVRYFGGKKLGVPGLINAYKSASLEAIKEAGIYRKYIEEKFKLTHLFNQTGQVMRALNDSEARIEENGFDNFPYIRYTIRRSKAEELKFYLLALLLKRDVSDISGEEEVEGFKLEEQ